LKTGAGLATVSQRNTGREGNIGVRKQSVSFTDTAFSFARELVESGQYPTISAAVSGELARAWAAREQERVLFEAEVQRRLALPLDAWESVRTGETITSGVRARLAQFAKTGGGSAA
jgi:antitoxin ParD1/3/4